MRLPPRWRPREYPRVRGEETPCSRRAVTAMGTPPRARGGGRETWRPPGRPGNTPACAGRRAVLRSGRSEGGEHPRVRGEERELADARSRTLGTPPRARGGGRRRSGSRWRGGNTPACAGRSDGEHRPHRAEREHPRVRGEEIRGSYRWAAREGTPPRARGGGPAAEDGDLVQGNTPACAGRRCIASTPVVGGREHPRVRGEEFDPRGRGRGGTGTPPRARGGGRRPVRRVGHGGNTPACAGRSREVFDSPPRPRGTPPRARGGAGRRRCRHARGGNTPACAGRSHHGFHSDSSTGEHPRVRGEEPGLPVTASHRAGTPPRARGGG